MKSLVLGSASAFAGNPVITDAFTSDPLRNPDHATGAQVVRWNADGTPDFGSPVPDGPYVAP